MQELNKKTMKIATYFLVATALCLGMAVGQHTEEGSLRKRKQQSDESTFVKKFGNSDRYEDLDFRNRELVSSKSSRDSSNLLPPSKPMSTRVAPENIALPEWLVLAGRVTHVFIKGSFGKLRKNTQSILIQSAQDILQGLIESRFGASGNEKVIASKGKIFTDKRGSKHVRFSEEINGLPVAGSGLILHADESGEIYAINGNFINGGSIPTEPSLDAGEAILHALAGSNIPPKCANNPSIAVAPDAKGGGAPRLDVYSGV